MDWSILLTYSWVLLVLIALEGLLSVDNAAVMAVQVKHVKPEEQKKALFYGLVGAFVFRLASLFLISFLATVWQVQAIGAAYLLFLFFKHLYEKYKTTNEEDETVEKEKKGAGFWMIVLKVEILDIAFAIDSILAAVALAITLPEASLRAQFIVIFDMPQNRYIRNQDWKQPQCF